MPATQNFASVNRPSRLSRLCCFQRWCVFTFRVVKMLSRRGREDAKMQKRSHLPSSVISASFNGLRTWALIDILYSWSVIYSMCKKSSTFVFIRHFLHLEIKIFYFFHKTLKYSPFCIYLSILCSSVKSLMLKIKI